MRRHGFLAVGAACITACCAWLLNQQDPLDASEEISGSFREAYSSPDRLPDVVEDDEGIRLNYFEAPWDRVLRNVADQAGLTLVMDKLPHGRFARRDRKRYQLDSALNVLNTALEPQGFRVFRQGTFLIALKLDQVRSRYARPVITEWKDASSDPAAAASPPTSGQFIQASARNENNNTQVTWAAQESTTPAANDNAPPVPAAAASQPFGSTVKPRVDPPQQVDSTEPAEPADPGPPVTETILVQNEKAAEVARSIYLVFEARAKLVKNGVNGLPSFVVRASETETDDAQPLFRIGIDQANNQLVMEASPARVTHLKRLVSELDKPQADQPETVKLVPNKGVGDATAKDLNEQIHRMVAMRNHMAQAGNLTPDELAAGGAVDAADGNSLNLRGEVNVQAMQDLGIIILKGNETDVEKVSRIIQQLEEMSVGSLPDIHLLYLEHMNSEAMSDLLTSVYEQLSELRQRGSEDRQTAAFIPVVQPNAILILTPQIELDAILELANQLDKQTDPEAQFRVFTLRNAIASQVAASLETFYEERGGLGTRIRVLADVRTNAVIVQGRRNDLAEVAKVIEKMDVDESGAIHRVEVVKLNHATAAELAETINTAIQSVTNAPQQTGGGGGGFGGFGAQGAQELRDSKSVALEFLAASGTGRELLRSGILVDVRVNPDIRSNSLIVSAPEASMQLLVALIRELDREPSATAEIKVFALRNADASQSVELLTSMFENQNQEEQLGVQIAGTEGSSSSLIPVTFSADVRTNAVLAVGGPEALSVVEAILLRLDTTESRQRQTTVIPLRNAQASLVALAVETYLDQQQELRDSSEDLISNIERLRQEVIVAPDDNSNSLIVESSPEYFSQITQIIEELDANPPQVVIQALLVEVNLDNTDEFGVELGFQDPTLFARSILESAESIVTIPQTNTLPNGTQTTTTIIESRNPTPGFNFNNTLSALGNNTNGDFSTVAAQGISNFSLGRQNGDLGYGGFVFSAQSDAVSVLVRALASRRTVHVLSRPQSRTTHNNTASIEVGQQVPVVDGVDIVQNIVSPAIRQQNVGIILEVTPRVTPDGTISMDVYAEKSALAPGGVPVFTDVTTGNVVESVIIDTAIADTTVAVPNGQTIVIGGMITKSDETLERKVPWLGDLPVLGSLFRYDGTNTLRTELLIFLTPRIIYSDADSELIKQVETERMHFVESEAEEIHGPIYSVPASGYPGPEMNFGPGMGAAQGMPPGAYCPPTEGAGEPTVLPPEVEAPPAGADSEGEQTEVQPKASLDRVSDSGIIQAGGTGSRSRSGVRRASATGSETKGKVEKTSWYKRLTPWKTDKLDD